jgi:hypothetical protein
MNSAIRGVAIFVALVLLCSQMPRAEVGAPSWERAVLVGPASLQSRGFSVVPVVVRLLRSDGTPAPAGIRLHASTSNAAAGFERLTERSFDVTTDSAGTVQLPLVLAPVNSQFSITLTDGTITRDVSLSVVAPPKQPFVVGLATVGAGPVPGWIEEPDNAADGTTSRRGALSLFGDGSVGGATRLTFAYDSATDSLAQSSANGPYLDNPNDRPFPIYGDESTRYDDALSTNHLFARLSSGDSSAMWGEFSASGAPAYAAGGYNILVNGAQLDLGAKNLHVNAFTARNDTSFARQIFAPTGLAIASELLHPDIVVGSDVLTLVVLDRRTGAILEQTPLVRGSDYVIDYASGLIRFLNIILPYDPAMNPQIVVAQYQYGGPGAETTMLGGSATLKYGDNPKDRIDAWYLNDTIGTGNLDLFGQAIAGASSVASWSISHEKTSGFLPITQLQFGDAGDAYRAYMQIKTPRSEFKASFDNTSAGYDNPFGTYTAPGAQSITATETFALSRATDLQFHYQDVRNMLPAVAGSDAVSNTDSQALISANVKVNKRFKYHIGVEGDWANGNGVVNPALLYSDSTVVPTPPQDNAFFPPLLTPVQYIAGSGNAYLLDYGFDWQFTPRASISLSRSSPLSSTLDPYAPPQTQAEFDLQVGADGKLFVRQLWQRSSIQALTGSQAVETYAGTASSSTQIGFEEQAGVLTYQSGYAVDHTSNGTDLYDAIGVQGKVLATKYLTANAFFQLGQQLYATYGTAPATSSPYFMVIGTSLDYGRSSFRATGQIQVRTGYDGGSTVQIGAAGPISPAVSLFGLWNASYTTFVEDQEKRVGLAYRPSQNDRYVTLISVDQYNSNLTNYDAYTTNVAQIEELYRPSTRTEFSVSDAYKLTGDAYFAPHTNILGASVDQKIGSRFDLGSEVHWSETAPLEQTNATGFAVEAGYRLGSELRLAVGYNFSGFADPSTAISPTHRGIYVTLTSYIDRIFGWGKDTP